MNPATEGQFSFNVDTFYVAASGGQIHRRAAPPEIKALTAPSLWSSTVEGQSDRQDEVVESLTRWWHQCTQRNPADRKEPEEGLKNQEAEISGAGGQGKSSTKTVITKTVTKQSVTTKSVTTKTTSTSKPVESKATSAKKAVAKKATPTKPPVAVKATPKAAAPKAAAPKAAAPKQAATKTAAAPKTTSKAAPVKTTTAKAPAAPKPTVKKATAAKAPAQKKATAPKASAAKTTAAKTATPKTTTANKKRAISDVETTHQPQIAKRPAYGGIQAQNNINVPVNNYQQSREWGEPDNGDEFEFGENRGYGYDSEYDDAPPPYDSLYEEMDWE
ncbi:hypothetical protein N7541_005585 [Penicillium brevicompactum]|uniref:Uncharacterized protein n=1 Tax=Penicillium brevicompactum TaxID=5074 RepID=A0A9W9R6H6_PENBR|nr:hypothetical protein N7541_005585 [Penicillium brevicompactum]